MDPRPDVIHERIDATRAALDRDLDRLNDQIASRKDLLAAQAQWWAGVSAVAAGTLGALLWWPRGRHVRPRRRLLRPDRVPA